MSAEPMHTPVWKNQASVVPQTDEGFQCLNEILQLFLACNCSCIYVSAYDTDCMITGKVSFLVNHLL